MVFQFDPAPLIGPRVVTPPLTYAALEMFAPVESTSTSGIDTTRDSRWEYAWWTTFTVYWPKPTECERFWKIREVVGISEEEPGSAFTECSNEDCSMVFDISKEKFSCNFGMRVQGTSINIPGCGGGGFFKEIYLSCPYSKKVACPRPTAPCNCIFVISYLMVIPLGSVLL
jgi:hypothetical protein